MKAQRRKRGDPYSGMKIGRLYVEECLILSKGDINDRGLFKCKCDCGNTLNVKGFALKNKQRASCGCLLKERLKEIAHTRRKPGSVTINVCYGDFRRACKEKNSEIWDKDKWLIFVQQPCYYCGNIDSKNSANCPSYRKKSAPGCSSIDIEMYRVDINGIDRVDSSKGYEIDNCVPCCAQCNYMKIQYPQEEFLEKAEIISTRHKYRSVSLESFLCN